MDAANLDYAALARKLFATSATRINGVREAVDRVAAMRRNAIEDMVRRLADAGFVPDHIELRADLPACTPTNPERLVDGLGVELARWWDALDAGSTRYTLHIVPSPHVMQPLVGVISPIDFVL